jgi:hypothetical protein
MGTIPEPVSQFLDWIFLDVASRAASGKNPDVPIAGLFRAYSQQPSKGRGKAGVRRGRSYMRRTDLSLRRYVAILALRKLGFTVDQAAAEVAVRLGKKTANEIDAIRTSFYKFHAPFSPGPLLASWEYCFTSWNDWAVRADARTIDFVAKELIIRKGLGKELAVRFQKIMQQVRSQPQVRLNREG